MSLTQLLQAYEPHFLQSLTSDDSSVLRESLQQLTHIQNVFHQEKSSGALTKENEMLLAATASRIEVIANAMIKMEQESDKRLESCAGSLHSYFDSRGSSAFSSSISSRKSSTQEKTDSAIPETLPSKQLRAWILENLSNPFPTRQDKEKLVKKTNLEEAGKATLAYNQVSGES